MCQRAYTKHSKGFRILDPTGTIQLEAQGKMFVDDKNLMHNNKKPNPSATELMEIFTHDLSLWDRYIWVTGGFLKQLKTEYCLQYV
eukprot:980848-Ditylum_brightwellii.AAC.1